MANALLRGRKGRSPRRFLAVECYVIYIWFLHNTSPLQVLRRTLNTMSALVQDVRVNHGRADVFVAEEFLDCADIIARL